MDKAALRQRMRAARKAAARRHPGGAGALARQLLPVLARLEPGTIIAGYVACGSEIDPLPLLEGLAAQGFMLALPRLAVMYAPLDFHRWHPGDPLLPGACGIPEPRTDADKVIPRLLLVPGIAFDAEGRRLGQGGGYYDRSLRALREVAPVIAIGLFYEDQRLGRLPDEAHDERLDLVATPEGLYDPDGTGLTRLERS